MEAYIRKDGKAMRCGYTTGSCAAAGAKACAEMLMTGRAVRRVNLVTPNGMELELSVHHPVPGKDTAVCAIEKDSGDDPDITNGILVEVQVSRRTDRVITVTGGKGVGRVTKPGLNQPVGAYAINATPRKMIRDAIKSVFTAYGYCGGAEVAVSIPEGEELAKKTFNPRLGIQGGLSVIGTTGIVEPMSSAAYVETIRLEQGMRRNEGDCCLLLTLGNYGQSFLSDKLNLPFERSVKCSNFIGDALDIAAGNGFAGILLVGHIGKLVKLGAGIFNTHSSHGDARLEILVTCALKAGAQTGTLLKITECVTTDSALKVLCQDGLLKATMELLTQRIEDSLIRRVGEVPVGAVMYSDRYGILGQTRQAEMLMKQIQTDFK